MCPRSAANRNAETANGRQAVPIAVAGLNGASVLPVDCTSERNKSHKNTNTIQIKKPVAVGSKAPS